MLDERAREVELLDGPDADPRLTERSYRLMNFVNRTGGGTRVVRDFLARELAGSGTRRIRILDLGSGGAGIPLVLARWGNSHDYELEFTCLDHNPKAIELGRDAVKRAGIETISMCQADVFEYTPERAFDYAIGSMFFHHFTAEWIGALIEHLRGFVRKALLINDLRRCASNYVVCRLLTVGLEPQIRHDALLSIARGFRPAELRMILSQHDPTPQVTKHWFCRIAGVVRFDREEGPCKPC